MTDHRDRPMPILANKHHSEASAFEPGNLLREARRHEGLAVRDVPAICVLDPDGDLVRRLRQDGRATTDRDWACYHSELDRFVEGDVEFGIVGCVVGASYAVLVAEQFFAAGCRLLISMTSSGQLQPVRPPPYFILIEQALRDEGTSYHYLPPSDFAQADTGVIAALESAFDGMREPAPFRETERAIATMTARGLLAVEMEAAALYAFAQACGKRAVCFAHVTNQMGHVNGSRSSCRSSSREGPCRAVAPASGLGAF
ncbi:MAG: uridine phosphorylase [Bosea sp. 12-68-7]|nr:MAG: uridine phosphorylase [Bosea sp. 12-68-7]